MSSKDIWYGILDAGEKTSPVVHDVTLDASQGKVWLYNHLRNQFIEYAKDIVKLRLRELTAEDIPENELDKAFKTARQAFLSSRKLSSTWTDRKPAARRVVDEMVDDEPDFYIADDDTEEFIDDD